MRNLASASILSVLCLSLIAPGCSQQSTWEAENDAGNRALARGQYSQAEQRYQAALTYAENFPDSDPRKTQTIDNLAETYKMSSRYTEAIPLRERAWKIREATLGPEHPDTTASFQRYAGAYGYANQHNRAEPLFRRHVEMQEKIHGPESPQTAAALEALAGTHLNLKRYAEAASLYQRALAIRQKVMPPFDPTIASAYHALILVHSSQKDFTQAEQVAQNAVTIFEKATPPQPELLALSLSNVAQVAAAQGKYAEARTTYQRAIGLLEKAKGSEDRRSLRCSRNRQASSPNWVKPLKPPITSAALKSFEAERSTGVIEKVRPARPRVVTCHTQARRGAWSPRFSPISACDEPCGLAVQSRG